MRAAWLEIDLGAYRRNIERLSAHAERPVLAVVKANGYGHGMGWMARAASETPCCAGVGVALPEEGAELRASGQTGRILVMGLSLEDQAELIARHDLEAVVTRVAMADALQAEAQRLGRRIPVHVKVDTGMSRVGLEPEETVAFCEQIRERPNLRVAGLMTHFASADEPERPDTAEQWRRFQPLMAELERWTPRPAFHAANSAAALWFPAAGLDWVRGGILTYGVLWGSRAFPFAVEPVAALKAKIVQVKEVPAGRSVSYGGAWTAQRQTRLALVPVGYADGYPWSLSNRGEVLVHGRRAPIRGRVCMDQMLVDVTDIPPVEVGETAVLVGKDGDDEITVQELADAAGTFSYEIVTRWAGRLPRVLGGA